MSDERVITDTESLIDFVMGDENESYHSPQDKEEQKEVSETASPEDVDTDGNTFHDDDDGFVADDSQTDSDANGGAEQASSAEQKAPSKEDSAAKAPEVQVDYQYEINNLHKRLHDTQKAMHEATSRASALQKRLDDLEKSKKEKSLENTEDDNWFSDSEDKAVAEIRQELSDIKKENDNLSLQQQDIQQQANLTAWHQAAAPLRQQYADFDELVYEKLEPLLDEKTGDARIRELYMQQQDRSPAGAYKFAKSLPMIREILDNPESFHQKMHTLEEATKIKKEEPVRRTQGRDAMRMVPSADFAESSQGRTRSLVDEVFG